YSNIIISYSELSLLNITVAAFFAVFVFGLFSYVRSRLLELAGKELNLVLRKRIFKEMIKGCAIDRDKTYKGGIFDLDQMQTYFSSPAVYALFDAPWAPFYLALIYLFHPVLGIIASLGTLTMLGLSGLQEVLVRKSLKEATLLNSKNQGFIESSLRNTEVINGMGMVGTISDRFARENRRVMVNQTESSRFAGSIQAAIKPLQNVIQVLIYCAGAYYAMTEGFDIGLMIAASIIMGRGLTPLMQLMSSWRLTTQARESYNRLKNLSAHIENQNRTDKMPLLLTKGTLCFDGVIFGVNNQLLIKGISFDLASGDFLGVIGPSGAGKTTLCRLLLGILPCSAGKVYLDGNDVFAWDKELIGKHIGYLPQVVELFPGTIAQNIARFGPMDDDLINQAVELAGIRPMISGFENGLDTRIEGENGIAISGGQRQRIGLARAVYGRPVLLVLDEPTSNMDASGEQQFLNTLQQIKQQHRSTCIMVTHKPSVLQSMDKILVLQNGQLTMMGPKDTVMAKLAGGS
ncbi:MAG: ATP-binding cassette domain-containing protein, partial [Desulfobacterales bacterium]|nr:ATP-binding cassette domain-containing protein [Desulfobacterales bacterium]